MDLKKEIINPIDIRKRFKKKSAFANWCFEQTIEDLNSHLRVFIDAEEYEDCAIIRDVIEFKKI